MDKDYLTLKRAAASRPSGEWDEDDYDVLADGVVVGRIMKAEAAPVGMPWMWTLLFDYHEDRTPTHGYEPTREAAMAAFAKSWRRICRVLINAQIAAPRLWHLLSNLPPQILMEQQESLSKKYRGS